MSNVVYTPIDDINKFINEKIDMYSTSKENVDIIYEIINTCYKDNKLIPKRTLNWLQVNNPNLYTKIIAKTDRDKIKEIIEFLVYNCSIPICKTCGEKNSISNKFLFKGYCSNRCTIKSDEVQAKTEQTCIDKYGKRVKGREEKEFKLGEHHLQKNLKNLDDVNNDAVMKKLQYESDWTVVANHFGFSTIYGAGIHKFMARYGYPIESVYNKVDEGFRSQKEREVYTFIESLLDDSVEIVSNTKKIIPPYEIDIYIPKYKLAIEFNGMYWHSSDNQQDDREYKIKHLRKTNLCEEQGIQVLHIFENEWDDPIKQEIWKSVISTKLGLNKRLYARQTILKDISTKTANDFCDLNHLQGSCSASFAKGLYYNDELVMVATFGKPRYNKSHNLELIRLCSKLNTTIVGGASKITKNINFISYANRRWSNGNVYNNLNMEKLDVTKPCYFYFKLKYNLTKINHRSKFMKHKLKSILENYDPLLSESANCYNNGYRRIWDCGNILYKTI